MLPGLPSWEGAHPEFFFVLPHGLATGNIESTIKEGSRRTMDGERQVTKWAPAVGHHTVTFA